MRGQQAEKLGWGARHRPTTVCRACPPRGSGASSRQGHRAHSEGFIPPGGDFGRLVRDQEKQWALESELVEVQMGKQADGRASCDGEADSGVRV